MPLTAMNAYPFSDSLSGQTDVHEELRECTETVLAAADLLNCVGTVIDPNRLHDRTVATMAGLITRETLKIASLLGIEQHA